MAISIWIQQDNSMTREAENVSSFLLLCQRVGGGWQLVCPRNYTVDQVKALAAAFYEETQKGIGNGGADPDREQTEPR